MPKLDISRDQAAHIAQVADSWSTYGSLPKWIDAYGSYGETFGEWLACYLTSLALEPEPPNLEDLQRAMRRASEEDGRARRAVYPTAFDAQQTTAVAHAKLIQARAAYIGARAMADAKNPHKDTTP